MDFGVCAIRFTGFYDYGDIVKYFTSNFYGSCEGALLELRDYILRYGSSDDPVLRIIDYLESNQSTLWSTANQTTDGILRITFYYCSECVGSIFFENVSTTHTLPWMDS